MHLVVLHREVPHLPATVYFDDMQWRALVPTRRATTLGKAVRGLARLGGHLARSSDPPRPAGAVVRLATLG